MANADHAEIALEVAESLTEEGQLVTFSRETGGTYNPVTEVDTGASTTTFTANALALDYSNSEIDGTTVQKGDVKLLAEFTTTSPVQNDGCTVNGVVYRVMDVLPFSPAGTGIFNYVQLRK